MKTSLAATLQALRDNGGLTRERLRRMRERARDLPSSEINGQRWGETRQRVDALIERAESAVLKLDRLLLQATEESP